MTLAVAHTGSRIRNTILGPGWPLVVVFFGVPFWWVLGVFQLAFFLACIPMVVHLARMPSISMPRGFSIWILFLLWVLGGMLVLQVDAPSTVPGSSIARYGVFLYRFAWYVTATIYALYTFNIRASISMQRVSLLIGWFFAWLTAGGLLGLAFPTLEFPSVLELILPNSLASNGFVQSLVHPSVAQVHVFLGFEQPRPTAPFYFTNEWGAAIAVSAPLFFVSWWSQSTPYRAATVVVGALAVIPIVSSLNRGLWGALIAALMFFLFQLARSGRPAALALALVSLTIGVVAVSVSPLATLVTDRIQTPHSNEGRGNLAGLTIESVLRGSALLGYGTTRDVQGSFSSISGGATFFCPACAPPPLGTQGQLWLLLFGAGVVGAALYVGFFIQQLGRGFRTLSPHAVAAQCSLVAVLVTLPVYSVVNPVLAIAFLSVAILAAETGKVDRRTLRSVLSVGPGAAAAAVVLMLVGLLAALAVLHSRPTAYEATQAVYVSSTLDPGGRHAVDLDTEAVVASSTTVLEAVREHTDLPSLEAASQVMSVGARVNSNILEITVADADAETARSAARAAATAYLEVRDRYQDQVALDREAELRDHLNVTADAVQELRDLTDDSLLAEETVRPVEENILRSVNELTAIESRSQAGGRLVSQPQVVQPSSRAFAILANLGWLGVVLGLAGVGRRAKTARLGHRRGVA